MQPSNHKVSLFEKYDNNYSTRVCWIWVAIIISCPKSPSEIIVLLKKPTEYWEFFPTLFVKTTDVQLCFLFWADAYSYQIIWRARYSSSYTMMAKPIRALELHYPIIKFLIILFISTYRKYLQVVCFCSCRMDPDKVFTYKAVIFTWVKNSCKGCQMTAAMATPVLSKLKPIFWW